MKTLADTNARQVLYMRLSDLRPDGVRLWGKMMPHEAICQLSDSFRACFGEKAISPAFALYAAMR